MSRPATRLVLGLLVLLGLCTGGFLTYRARQQRLGFRTLQDLVDLSAMTVGTALYGRRLRDFPRGDIGTLYEWAEQWTKPGTLGSPLSITVVDQDRRVFVDAWRQPLVYHFPPRQRRDLLFDLYSIGPNGIDEGGQGDDICDEEVLALKRWIIEIRDGQMSCEWFWQHVDELKMDWHGRLVHTPPDNTQQP